MTGASLMKDLSNIIQHSKIKVLPFPPNPAIMENIQPTSFNIDLQCLKK